MNTTLDVTIRIEQLKYLGSLLQSPITPISPFSAPETPMPMDEEGRRQLISKNLLTTDNRISDELRPLFEELAGARKYSSVVLGCRATYLDIMVYHVADGTVLFTMEGQNIHIITPAPMSFMIGLLDQHLGHSLLRSADLDISLKRQEAIILMSIIDIRRRQGLGAMLDRGPLTSGGITLSAIQDWLAGKQSTQWLATQMKAFTGTSEPLSPEVIQQALEGLVGKDLISEQGGSYIPGGVVETLAERFIVLDGQVLARSVQLDKKNRPVLSIFQIIVSSFTDQLLWDARDRDNIHLLSMAPGAAVKLLAAFLTDKDIIDDASALISRTCPKCGASVPEKGKFCLECGARVDEKPASTGKTLTQAAVEQLKCAKCGAVIEAGAKFCLQCGAKVAVAAAQAKPIFCPECGTKAEASEKFCRQCGHRLEA